MTEITHKNIRHPKCQTNAEGKAGQDNRQGHQPEHGYREMMAQQGKDPKHGNKQQRVVKQIGANHDGGQGYARELHLLHQVTLLYKEVEAASDDFAEQRPRQQTGHEIDGVGVFVINARQFGGQDIAEDEGIDGNLCQRVDDHPYPAKFAAGEAADEFVADGTGYEVAILPQTTKHAEHQTAFPWETRLPACAWLPRVSTLRRNSGSVLDGRRLKRQPVNSILGPSAVSMRTGGEGL